MILENGVLIKGSTPNRSLEAATSMEQVLRTAGGREEVGEHGGQMGRAPGQHSESEQGSHRKSHSAR